MKRLHNQSVMLIIQRGEEYVNSLGIKVGEVLDAIGATR
jgi:hypothetical protein